MVVLIETMISNKAYSHNRMGYVVVCLPVSSKDDGGVQGWSYLVVQERPKGWSMELMLLHGPNMVSCKFIYSVQMTLLIRA